MTREEFVNGIAHNMIGFREDLERYYAHDQAQREEIAQLKQRLAAHADLIGQTEQGLRDGIARLREALTVLMEEKIDYMRINHLGDPETQHSIKLAKAALAKEATHDMPDETEITS